MAGTATKIDIGSLGKTKLAALREQAKSLGLSPEKYARQLIDEGILLKQKARTTTFDELFAPIQAKFKSSGMTEADLDELVDEARRRPRATGKRR